MEDPIEFKLVYIPRIGERNYYYNKVFNNIWTLPKDDPQLCFMNVYGSIEAFKELFELELQDNKEAPGGLTQLGIKLLK
ncbi:hypothetical protein [Clostridium estertheticum]|uniref:hypothetical protein n=1 Tax=Clostridium estertheticum TaxID=238834 RepID=UPI001C0CF581|nr:hypothetical protein [Clostridium estertheticum]MBU3186613.1 hypothetical protein [Clostridium estertheticum]